MSSILSLDMDATNTEKTESERSKVKRSEESVEAPKKNEDSSASSRAGPGDWD